jgi:hypothetical protein
MVWIGSANGTGSVGGISFSSIPQTFTHLQLRGTVRTLTTTSQLYTRLNNDAGSNYATHYLLGDGSGVSSASGGVSTTVNLFGSTVGPSDLANAQGSFLIDILDYTSTAKNKTTKNTYGHDLNGTGQVWFSSSVWMNTAAVNAITLVANAPFTTSTRLDLYGITSSQVTGA